MADKSFYSLAILALVALIATSKSAQAAGNLNLVAYRVQDQPAENSTLMEAWECQGASKNHDAINGQKCNRVNPGAVREHESQAWLLNPSSVADLQRQYAVLNRDYDMRRAYGLMSPELERAHLDQMAAFSTGLRDTVMNTKVDTYRNTAMDKIRTEVEERLQVKKFISENPKLVTTAGVFFAAYAIYTGAQPFDLWVHPTTKLHAMSNLQQQRGQVAVNSTYINGSVDVSLTAPNNRGNGASAQDMANKDEKFRIAVWRDLPMGFSAGLTYSGSATTLSGSISKDLGHNVRASLETVSPLDPNGVSEIHSPEERVSLSYGVTF
ncbi:MAG: hypothetical protein ACXWPM_01780 [Bdellovibrionota bacterium]